MILQWSLAHFSELRIIPRILTLKGTLRIIPQPRRGSLCPERLSDWQEITQWIPRSLVLMTTTPLIPAPPTSEGPHQPEIVESDSLESVPGSAESQHKHHCAQGDA